MKIMIPLLALLILSAQQRAWADTLYVDCNLDTDCIGAPCNPANSLGPDGLPFTDDDRYLLKENSPTRGTGFGRVDMGTHWFACSDCKSNYFIRLKSNNYIVHTRKILKL